MDFLILLLEFERSVNHELKKRISLKIKKIQNEHQNISKLVTAKVVEVSAPEAHYYSSWHWMAIHLIVGIPQFQTVKEIALRLSLSESIITTTLVALEKMGYVESFNGKWRYKGGNIHLASNSPSVVLHHNNWRQRGLLDASLMNAESIHYTSVITMSRVDADILRLRILEWIQESRQIIAPSANEEIMCLNLDYFKV
jgi:DNA-binding transcriptional ArsR family regulator